MPANTNTVKKDEPCALTLATKHRLKSKTIGYDPVELKEMHLTVLNQHDHRNKVLPIDAIKTIRTLRLNHKRRRHLYTAQKRKKLGPTKANTELLINIKKTPTHGNTNVTIGTCNIQSLRNKDLQVSDLLANYSMDILALMAPHGLLIINQMSCGYSPLH